VVEWPWKYVEYSRRPGLQSELYDLSADPRELKNLAADRPAEVARFSAMVRSGFEKHD
jgi:hypothetical protein